MNKILLLTSLLLAGFYIQAQEAVNIQAQNKDEAIIENLPLETEYQAIKIPQNTYQKDGETETIYLGTSGNIYTALLGGNNQVSYNPVLDAVTFIHRKDDAAPLNGVMQFDYSTDGGATWEVNQGPLSPGFEDGTVTTIGNGLRYPNGVLWAPEGSTSSDDAYIVGTGPTLDTESGSWGNLFQVSSKLDGSNLSEEYVNFAGQQQEFNVDFHPYGTSLVNDAVWSVSTQFNTSGDTAYDTVSYQQFYITKGTFNETTFKFDYEVVETITPNWIQQLDEADGTLNNFFQTYNMAWGPDGIIGYVVLVGARENGGAYEPVPKPNVWKTTDGGDTWYELPEFDFQTLDNMQDFLADPVDGNMVRPYFTDTDAVVGSDGELHLFSHVLSGFTNHPDSAGFIYTDLTSQYFYHVRTSGETAWEADIISDVVNSDDAADFTLGDQPLRFKLQASRTPDGDKVFFSWHKAIDNLILTSADIFARGYDIPTEVYASEKNLTIDTDYEEFTFFQTMAPVCKQGGECFEYELPIVFLEPGSDDLSSCQHIYLYGAGFDDINFDPNSVQDISAEAQLGVYPNPSSGYFQVNLPNDINGLVQVYDVSGKLIYEAQNQMNSTVINLEGHAPGSYVLKYISENETRTEALIIR